MPNLTLSMEQLFEFVRDTIVMVDQAQASTGEKLSFEESAHIMNQVVLDRVLRLMQQQHLIQRD